MSSSSPRNLSSTVSTQTYSNAAKPSSRQGVAPDTVEAHKWIVLAATQGYPNAGKFQETLERKMSAAQVIEGQRRAKEWREKNYR